MTADLVGIQDDDFNEILSNILQTVVADWNEQYKDGYDLKKKVPILKFVSGMFKNFILTPNQEQGFIYGGFSWLSDK